MSIAARLILGFVVFLVIVAGLGFAGMVGTERVRELTAQLYEHPFSVSNAALTLESDIQAIRLAMINVALADDVADVDHWVGEVDRLEADGRVNLAVVRGLFLGDPALVALVTRDLDTWKGIRAEVIDAKRRGDGARTMAIVRGRGGNHFERLDASVREIVSFAQHKAGFFADGANQAAGGIVLTTAVGLVVSLVLGLGIAALTTWSVSWPLSRLADAMESLAAEDKTTPPIPFQRRRDEIGTMARAVAVFKEHIQQRRSAEVALREAKEEAELASHIKSEFLSIISHELRTPLNAVIGFSDPLLVGASENDDCARCHRFLSQINLAGRHLLRLVEEILDAANLETGGTVALADDRVEVAEAAAEAARAVCTLHPAFGVAVDLDFPESLPVLRADSARVTQMLANLLDNALKYSLRGGRVTVSSATGADGSLALVVADTGVGMSRADIPVALSLFGQVGSGLSRCNSGIGLGLPLTRRLIELHGGHLTLESAPGQGTTATLHFPPDRVEPPGAAFSDYL